MNGSSSGPKNRNRHDAGGSFSEDAIIRLTWRDKLVGFGLFSTAAILAGLIAAVVYSGLLALQYLLIMVSAPGMLDDSFTTVVRIVLAVATGLGCAFIWYPDLIRRIFRGRELRDEQIERSLNRLISMSGMNIVAEKIYAIRGRKANAVLVGLFRKSQYIFFTDKLLERMNEEEITAILAHELAHARHWHLPKMLLPIIGWTILVQGVLQLLDFKAVLDSIDAFWLQVLWLTVVCMGNIYLLMFLFLIPQSRRHEYQADATAARWVGINRYKQALHRMHEINGTLKPTGKVPAKLRTHPTLEERLERLG